MKILTLKKVNEILDKKSISHHYLRYKNTKNWDKYDISNFKSILDIELEFCKICHKRLSDNDSWLNEYKICKSCLAVDKFKSLKEQASKRGQYNNKKEVKTIEVKENIELLMLYIANGGEPF